MNDHRPPTDPFATFINLMGRALSGPTTRAAYSAAAGGALPADEPMPLRPEPADRKAAPPTPAPQATWFERLDNWFWRQRQSDLERRLAGATDLAEVERRLRERERSLLHRYY